MIKKIVFIVMAVLLTGAFIFGAFDH